MSLTLTSQWKLGTTAAGMVPIPDPDPNIDRTPLEGSVSRRSLGGRLSKTVLWRKGQWVMSFTSLTFAQADSLAAYWAPGVKGPFYLYDPVDGSTNAVEIDAKSDVPVSSVARNISITFVEA